MQGSNRGSAVQQLRDRKTREINENLAVLKKALFAEDGGDKDVTLGIAPPFLRYVRNGINVEIVFSPQLKTEQLEWAFDLTKERMESIYDLSGYGWDDEDKRGELLEPGARFLLLFDRSKSSATWGELVGFVHFRFTVQGELMDMMEGDTCVFVWDIQIEDGFQRKGLARHLLTLLELIGTREGMKAVSVPIQNADSSSREWIHKLKGYIPDQSIRNRLNFDPQEEGFEVFSKPLKSIHTLTSPIPARIPDETPSPVEESLAPDLSRLNLNDHDQKSGKEEFQN